MHKFFAHDYFSTAEVYFSGLVPHVGMEFKNSDEAWAFWGQEKVHEQEIRRWQGYFMPIYLCKEMQCLISFAKQNSVILIKSENVQVARATWANSVNKSKK